MNIKLNGEIKTVNHSEEEFFLEDLIAQIGYQPQLVVVELNGTIINPQEWNKTKIKDGDCFELLSLRRFHHKNKSQNLSHFAF